MESQNRVKDSQTSGNLENDRDRESSIESFRTTQSEPSTTTESELIDINDIELSDEESWLYESPKRVPILEEKSECAIKQCSPNEGINDNIQKESRHELLSKLNQLRYRVNRNGENKVNKSEVSASLHSIDKTTEQQMTGDTKNICEENNDKNVEHQRTGGDNSICEETTNDKNRVDDIYINKTADTEKKPSHEEKESKTECLDSNSSVDVVDVQKLAKLQAESLKQSTYKFMNYSGIRTPSSRNVSPDSPSEVLNLNKPASVEGLNTCSEKMNPSDVCLIVPLQVRKKQSLFSSSSELNATPESRSGSLPNINKGYYSLKSRKPKRQLEQKVSCPLPVYPVHSKIANSGSPVAVSTDHNDSFPSCDHRQSNTLPSSYRMNSRRSSCNSRSTSASRRDLSSLSPTKRKDSTPVTRRNSSVNSNSNYRKFSSPIPLNASPRYATAVSSTKAVMHPQTLRPSFGAEYQRSASHSPARRLPLATVQHPSSKIETSLKNGEMRQILVPSKLQNRSGIPVPSACQPQPDDNNWSQDCF